MFVHIPGKPGGKLGAMDAAVGVLLSISLLIPLIIMESFKLSPLVASAISISSFAIGLAVFAKRQSIHEENGFLAVVLTSIGIGKSEKNKQAPRYGNHWFFKRAAREFGDDAIVGPAAVFKIATVFVFVSMFWSLFDQNGSSWIRQAADMDRPITVGSWSFTILPEQVQALNPILVMCLIPLTSIVFYPSIEKFGFIMTPLRRMGLGMFFGRFIFRYCCNSSGKNRIWADGIDHVASWGIYRSDPFRGHGVCDRPRICLYASTKEYEVCNNGSVVTDSVLR